MFYVRCSNCQTPIKKIGEKSYICPNAECDSKGSSNGDIEIRENSITFKASGKEVVLHQGMKIGQKP